MAKQAFGGDDDTEYVEEEEPKKLKLSKFELAPDYNIRDLLWKILGSYEESGKPGVELSKFKEHRFALEKAAISVLEGRRSHFYGLSPQFVARYSMMMCIDGEWNDAFMNFICDAKESKVQSWRSVVLALKHLISAEGYGTKITGLFVNEIRNPKKYPCILFYIPKIKDAGLAENLKRELSIFARGEMEENQMNALDAVTLLEEDTEVKNILISLLRHWDVKVRKKAAEKLKNLKLNKNDIEIIEKRMEAEPDKNIKNMLKRKVKKWKRK